MTLVHRILVPTDFSDHAERAFAYAAELAGLYRASLVIGHVYAIPVVYAAGEPIVAMPPPGPDSTIEADLEAGLRALVQRARDAGAADVSVVTTGGEAAHEIVRLARDESADLIVMGSHGRTGIKHLVLGSIAEKVVRLAHCPVLTVGARAA
jgi:nucleotide-binding universal stress UspA family protein